MSGMARVTRHAVQAYAMSDVLLRVEKVTKRFGGARAAVRPSERGQRSGPGKPQEDAPQ